jgi:hypothetical protein
MNRNFIWILMGIIVIIIALVLIFNREERSEDAIVSSGQNVSNEIDTELRAMVSEFGLKMKNVSLLSPSVSYRSQIQTQYGEFLTPELLQAWQSYPKIALGRNVSSPWPERIEVVEVAKVGEQYIVSGNVIEITSADKPMEPAGIYPVTFTIERIDDEWFISKVEKGAYSELPRRITVKGIWECLPQKDTSGPQTMECAFGIKEGNKHYALNLNLLSSGPVNFPTGTQVEAEGVLTKTEALSTDMWQKYPIEGILSVTSIKKI